MHYLQCESESALGQGRNHVFNVGGPILGLGYCTEQNTDDIPSFVHCSLQLRKKLGWSVQIWGVRTPLIPQWLRPCTWPVISTCRVETEGLSKVTDSEVHGKSSNMGALKM